ncbi:MAG TPA: YccF domain-containing protein [Gaiellaceae bacterium]|nr:YccF domain-containing protein [Gaiellaceae bacterium]
MRVVLNIIWLVLAGVWLAIGYVLAAVLMAITIVGSPFSVQAIKLAGAAVVPFGKEVVPLTDLARRPPHGGDRRGR